MIFVVLSPGKLGNIVAETLFPVDVCHVSHRGQTRKHLL